MQEILSSDAWHLLSSDNNALIIDVRTHSEWEATGIARGNNICISIMEGIERELNPNFMSLIANKVTNSNTPLLFICKSGGRSAYAAKMAEAAGYVNCYNVIDGMEGSDNGKGWLGYELPTEKFEATI